MDLFLKNLRLLHHSGMNKNLLLLIYKIQKIIAVGIVPNLNGIVHLRSMCALHIGHAAFTFLLLSIHSGHNV